MGFYDTATQERADLLRKFQAAVVSADVKVDEEFQRVIREAQALLEVSDREIADALSVSRPTVNRWINGKNLPYYAMRKPIVAWIRDRLTVKIKRLEASARQFAASYSRISDGLRTATLMAKHR
jgi:transcriptional regulator with XRE-family HTH domain